MLINVEFQHKKCNHNLFSQFNFQFRWKLLNLVLQKLSLQWIQREWTVPPQSQRCYKPWAGPTETTMAQYCSDSSTFPPENIWTMDNRWFQPKLPKSDWSRERALQSQLLIKHMQFWKKASENLVGKLATMGVSTCIRDSQIHCLGTWNVANFQHWQKVAGYTPAPEQHKTNDTWWRVQG